MRIISGKYRGRKYFPPVNRWPTRPTTDSAREALFNILANRLDFEELRALDLFGGTGSHSFELLSRNCPDVTYVDKHPGCVQYVRTFAKELGELTALRVVREDVLRFLRRARPAYDYIFADPPYDLADMAAFIDLIFERQLLKPHGLLVVEHDQRQDFNQHPRFIQERKYGQTRFSLFGLLPGGAAP